MWPETGEREREGERERGTKLKRDAISKTADQQTENEKVAYVFQLVTITTSN